MEEQHHNNNQHDHGEKGNARSVLVSRVAEPRRAKTAPNTFEAMARNRTMLDVCRVLYAASLNRAHVSSP